MVRFSKKCGAGVRVWVRGDVGILGAGLLGSAVLLELLSQGIEAGLTEGMTVPVLRRLGY